MKKIFVCLTLCLSGIANANVLNGMWLKTMLLSSDPAARMQAVAYIAAVSDSQEGVLSPSYCMPKTAKITDAATPVLKYLILNPEELLLPANIVVTRALYPVWPVPQVKKLRDNWVCP